MIASQNCLCHQPPFIASGYEIHMIGIDTTNGRFGEVKMLVCKSCKTSWLMYQVEYESIARSGRWYRGIIDSKDIKTIKPETAEAYLEILPWYFLGGSFFDTMGKEGKGTLLLDI